MAWAEPEELRKLLRRGSIDEAAAAYVLELAEEAVRGYLDQVVDLVESDVATLDGNGRRKLLLPELPVLDVASVAVNGVALDEGVDYTWSTSGVLTRVGACWPATPRSVVVIYDHGYAAPVPKRLSTVAVQWAARVWARSVPGATSVRIGDYAVTFAAAADVEDFTKTEQRQLRPFGHHGSR